MATKTPTGKRQSLPPASEATSPTKGGVKDSMLEEFFTKNLLRHLLSTDFFWRADFFHNHNLS